MTVKLTVTPPHTKLLMGNSWAEPMVYDAIANYLRMGTLIIINNNADTAIQEVQKKLKRVNLPLRYISQPLMTISSYNLQKS